MATKPASVMLNRFTQINSSVFVYKSPGSGTRTREAAANLNPPDVVLLLSWSGANIKHVAKYTLGYIDLYPGADIILVTSAFTDFILGSSASKKLQLKPVIQAYTSNPKARVLVHLFSNGGSHKLWTLAKLYKETEGRLLPMNAIVLDSGPGRATFERTGEALAYELPNAWYLRLPSMALMYLFVFMFWAVLTVTGWTNIIDRVWQELNDPDLISIKATREYIYSKADKLVMWKDVENHADEAEAKGYQTKKETYENTGHVAHMKLDQKSVIGLFAADPCQLIETQQALQSIMEEVISSSDLRTAIRFALRATSFALKSKDIAEGPPGRDSAQFRALIAGILFSRRFILTYQVVIACLLVVFTLAHGITKYKRRGRRSRISKEQNTAVDKHAIQYEEDPTGAQQSTEESRSISSSSSSSTLQGTGPSTPKSTGRADERTSLLKHQENQSRRSRKTWWSFPARAWLTYQPRPIPVVNKVLPSNSTSVAILLLIVVNLFYTLYKVPFSISMLFVFADRASLVFVANLPWLYLFAAKNQPIKMLTGYSYESLNIVHRRLGEIMCLLALAHSIGMVVVWYTLLRPVGLTLARFLLSKIILLGIGAFVAYEAIYFTSLGTFRRRWYELFLGLHIFLQVAALILLFFHHHGSRIYVAIALAIFLVDRLVYRITLKTRTYRGTCMVYDDQMTVGLSISVPISEKAPFINRILGHNVAYGWRPTDHVFLSVPNISHKHFIQSHPFTIASRAPALDADVAKMDFVIRAQDGFSGDLLRYSKGHKEAKVRLDGPYGSQDTVEMLQDSDSCVIVAGGSGIAVTWPLVWAVVAANNNSQSDLESNPRSFSSKKILFIWIVQKTDHLSWLGKDQIDELRSQGVTVLIPPATEVDGRPDVASIVEAWVTDNDDKFHDRCGKTGVVCSGPDGMGRAVRNVCSALQAKGRNVSVSIEKFGW
ncbi:hypothetical protein MMC18_009500 [Xylographa bjoerkii]|nr:hypothetical protein [Xylographa bjoerkii]MCJ1396609.1 hypothetical protein [Xylographa bjoerkii]